MLIIKDSWKSLFHYTTGTRSNECRLDVASIDLQDIDAMIRRHALQVLYDTPVEWWYGGVLHACFDLLCNSTNYDNVRPLFPLVLSITRNVDTRFMLGTVNYFGETPIHVITNRKKGRANTSLIAACILQRFRRPGAVSKCTRINACIFVVLKCACLKLPIHLHSS